MGRQKQDSDGAILMLCKKAESTAHSRSIYGGARRNEQQSCFAIAAAVGSILLLFITASSIAQITPAPPSQAIQDRPPAVPLVVHNPYFSVWSMGDRLTSGNTRHWTNADEPLDGLIRIDGALYRYIGIPPHQTVPLPDMPPMRQTSLKVTPLHTRYQFEQAGVRLNVTFFTPSFPDDLDVLSRPVTYLTWSAVSLDGKLHHVQLLLDANPVIAVNEETEPVTWGRLRTQHLTVLSVGTKAQQPLNQPGDKIRIDWGYFHLIVPDGEHATMSLAYSGIEQFANDGSLPAADDADMPRPAWWRAHAAHLDADFDLGQVGTQPVERHMLLSYTTSDAIEYLGRRLHPYWRRNGMTEAEMFEAAASQYVALGARGDRFDEDLMRDMTTVGGKDYAYLTALAFRQTLGAHELVADIDGQPMLFSKENASNGCIDTVDVTYPSAPFFLFFNPVLLQAQLEPMLRYASLPRWHFPFAPHDLGTYPLADGQVYGGGETSEDNQMPVEESGDLILLTVALERERNDWSFAEKYLPEFQKWAAYLADKGIDPANQLSTDDFSGHLAHNANLSIKAIEALAAFAEIATHTGHPELATRYETLAHSMSARWIAMAQDGDHYKLAFDKPGTWSQLYNLVWDKQLELNLFPPSVAQNAWAFYATQMQPYGLPLDSRKTITKLDWEFWTATLSANPAQFADLASRIHRWTNDSPSRVPLTDYYDTVSGNQIAFQARSVVGGIFIKALASPATAARWKHATQ
jgi:hypothetical protein